MPTPEDTARLLEDTVRLALPVGGPGAVHPVQWSILRYLAEAALPARTIGHVARHLGVTHAPASRAISALIRRGLVIVVESPDDRRLKHPKLSQAGLRWLEGDPIHRLMDAIGDLNEDQLAGLGDTLALLYEDLSIRRKT